MGFKGKKNVYLCDSCGRGFISQDIDEGTTPFMAACITEGCKSMAHSLFYNVPQEILANAKPAVEWYKPDEKELGKLSPAHKSHVMKGGLLPRMRE